MWVFEEEIEGRKLTEIINTEHENVKYLPEIKLPTNLVARDIADTVQDADLIVSIFHINSWVELSNKSKVK